MLQLENLKYSTVISSQNLMNRRIYFSIVSLYKFLIMNNFGGSGFKCPQHREFSIKNHSCWHVPQEEKGAKIAPQT